jgi:hypothetical protein
MSELSSMGHMLSVLMLYHRRWAMTLVKFKGIRAWLSRLGITPLELRPRSKQRRAQLPEITERKLLNGA